MAQIPNIDSIIDRFLKLRGDIQVQLTATEIWYLCARSSEIFLSQSILLKLEGSFNVNTFIKGYVFASVPGLWNKGLPRT